MDWRKLMESLHLKFKSDNGVIVSEAIITREEYEHILLLECEIHRLKSREVDLCAENQKLSREILEGIDQETSLRYEIDVLKDNHDLYKELVLDEISDLEKVIEKRANIVRGTTGIGIKDIREIF